MRTEVNGGEKRKRKRRGVKAGIGRCSHRFPPVYDFCAFFPRFFSASRGRLKNLPAHGVQELVLSRPIFLTF